MTKCIVFCVGAVASLVSEIFWRGRSRAYIALWGGLGMLLLRRIVLRFPFESRALLCLFGALLLAALQFAIQILKGISSGSKGGSAFLRADDRPGFSYGLYRFLLIAPAFTVIEYLENIFNM